MAENLRYFVRIFRVGLVNSVQIDRKFIKGFVEMEIFVNDYYHICPKR